MLYIYRLDALITQVSRNTNASQPKPLSPNGFMPNSTKKVAATNSDSHFFS